MLTKEQKQIEEILAQLKAGLFENLDIKKLKGSYSIYRVRKGNIRVIYQVANNRILLLKLSRRSEKTYKNL